ncbi:MAG: hypothetical protein ACREN5_03305, partial [Gemmatimonadales bacterium]
MVGAALWGTARRAETAPSHSSLPAVFWVAGDPVDVPTISAPVGGDIAVPVDPIPGLPPLDLDTKWDPRWRWGGGRDSTGAPDRPSGWGGEVIEGALSDESPELLAAPRRYPPLLQQAGIEGRVILRVVVDT